ncbi:hypothetical protein EDC94DRAFT_590427 [Helicostylum pulchrum]|nr:hypothetical protein EDC94DRAFT_590427 [Helicostylum pulchrum]
MNNSSNSQANAITDADYENDINNNVDMHRNSRLVIAENRSFRPANTNAAYSIKQEEYKIKKIHIVTPQLTSLTLVTQTRVIKIKKFDDGIIVTDEKLCFFLTDFVMTRVKKYKKNGDETSFPLGDESILVYVEAVKGLY